jgi:hypothetical protein
VTEPSPAQILAEEIVDWILKPNTPEKETLKVFSLGLTPEGQSVRDNILSILRILLRYEPCDDSHLVSTRFPRETLLKMARLAVERIPHEVK